MARGQPLQDHNGRVIGDGDFTKIMITEMRRMLQKNREGRTPAKAPRSIPELMNRDRYIASNPLRVLVQLPKKKCYNIIKRIKTWPIDIRGQVPLVVRQDRLKNEGQGDDEADTDGDAERAGELEDERDEDELSEHNEERVIRFFAVKIQGDKPAGDGDGDDDSDEGFDEPDTMPNNSADDSTEESSDHSSTAHSDNDGQAPPADEDTNMSDSDYPPLPDTNEDGSTLFVPQGPYWPR